MSKGSKIVPVRFDDATYASMIAEIERYNQSWKVEPFTVSTFIRKAVLEKIAYHQRGRKSRSAKHIRTGRKGSAEESTGHGQGGDGLADQLTTTQGD